MTYTVHVYRTFRMAVMEIEAPTAVDAVRAAMDLTKNKRAEELAPPDTSSIGLIWDKDMKLDMICDEEGRLAQ